MSLDREGIRKLMALYTLGRLTEEFRISRPTLRYYMKGVDPHHPAVTDFINAKVKELLPKPKEK